MTSVQPPTGRRTDWISNAGNAKMLQAASCGARRNRDHCHAVHRTNEGIITRVRSVADPGNGSEVYTHRDDLSGCMNVTKAVEPLAF